MARTIRRAVKDLLAVVKRLNRAYPHKAFTLDGRLVGDIGEILVAEEYGITLFDRLAHHHDGRAGRRLVQIKATMKSKLNFPADHVPDYYIGIKIEPDGTFRTVYNGPGRVIAAELKDRIIPGNNLHGVSLSTLERLDKGVSGRQRIRQRTQTKKKRAKASRRRG